jgi:hypothetical protein
LVRQTAKVLFLEVFGAVFLLLLIAIAGIVIRLASGPIEIGIFKDDVEAALTRARGGNAVSFERLLVLWSPEESRVLIEAEGVDLFNADGRRMARAEAAEIDLDASALFGGEVRVEGVILQDGNVDITHLGGDRWDIAGQPVTITIPAAESFDLRLVLSRVDSVVSAIFDAIEADSDAVTLDYVTVESFAVEFIGLSGETLATLPRLDARLSEAPGGAMELRLTTLSPGAGLPERLSTTLSANAARDALELSVSLSDWSLEALVNRVTGRATPAGLNVSEGLPVSGTLSLSARRETGLEALGWELQFGEGRLPLPGGGYPVAGASLWGAFDVEEQVLRAQLRDFSSARISGDMDITIGRLLDEFGTVALPVTLSSPRLRVDPRPAGEVAWALDDVEFSGAVDPVAGSADVERLRFGYAGFRADARGFLGWGETFRAGRPPITLQAEVAIDGTVTEDDMMAFWPPGLGTDARKQVRQNFLSGTMEDVQLSFDLAPGRTVDGVLADDAMEITYAGRDVSYRFLPDIPPARGAEVRGRLTGNGLSIDVLSGKVSDWAISGGRVEISRFKPAGGTLTVTGSGQGPVRDVLRVLQDSSLAIGREEGLDVSRFSGAGEGDFEVRRRVGMPEGQEDLDFRVDGRMRRGGLEDVFRDLDLTGANASITVTPERLNVSGYGDVDGTAVTFEWADGIGRSAGARDGALLVRGTANADTLNRFGLALRAFVSGEIPMEIRGAGDGTEFDSVEVFLDLTPARLDLTEIGLRKPPGEAGQARITYFAPGEDSAQRYDVRVNGEDFELSGAVRYLPDGRIDVIDVTRAFVAGRLDVAGAISRGEGDRVNVRLNGPFLDASGLFDGMSGLAGDGGSLEGELNLGAEVGELQLGEGLGIRDATLSARVRGGQVEALAAEGETAPGRSFSAALARQGNGMRSVRVRADDASFFLLALLDIDFLLGGELELDGVLRPGNQPSRFDLKLFNARLADAPMFTQVLSLASLQGLADTLSGEGVLFTEVDLPLTVSGDRFVVRGGRASGPALGVTVNGFVDFSPDGGIDLSGVLVPSFGINSALGGIPVIGDLFVSREGEGVFSLTYGVEGTLARAQVSVNPLSAITPGVLRRIFENPADTDVIVEQESVPDPNAAAEPG